MPDKKYLIEIPDMPEGSGIWDADKWERNKDTFMADYPEANVFELGDYDENDSRETDQIMLSFEDNEELSGIWDSAKWERNKEAFVQDYPEAKINRVRYVDYWGDAAKQNRERRKELDQPDVERDARLAEIGYFDDLSGEQKTFDMNSPAMLGLKPLSSAVKQNSVSGETEYLDPRVAEFYANDTAYTERLAERARLDAEYESNPSVIAQREYEAELARYAAKLEEEIKSDMESDIDTGKFARGFARKNMPGTATAYATSGSLSKDTIGESLENEKYERYSTAVKLLEKAKIARNVAGKGFGGAVIDWAKEGFMDKTTQSDVEAYNEIGNILSRIEKEVGSLKAENITEEVFDKYLSKDEQALIKAFFEYNSAMAEAQQDMSGWYKGGKIFAESVPFMLEFLATGGLYKAAGRASTRGLEKALVKWITKSTGKSVASVGRKVLGSNAIGFARALAGTTARTLVSPGTYDRMAEASIEIDDEGHLHRAKNAAVGFADMYVENLSEISGGLIGKGLGYLGRGAGKLAKTLGGAPLAKFGSWLGDQKLVQSLTKGWSAAAPKLEKLGFHGLPEEIGEEFIGNTIREFGIQPGALEEMVSDDNFGAMLIGFAPMTLLGAGAGAVSIGVVNAKASKLGQELRQMFSSHYDTKEIDSIMQSLSGATTAKEIKEMLKPMEASVMDALSRGMITREQAVEEIEMLYQYGGFIAQNNALLFGQQARENELATAKRAEMTDRYGRFWQQDETETVEVATLNNGKTVFVVSAPAEDGKIPIVDAITGEIGFAYTSDIVTREVDGEQIQATNKMSMAAFLNGQIAMQRKTEEETRMANERNAQIDALRAQVTPGTRINLGTEGSPVYVFAKKVGADGVTVVDETGMETRLGWDQTADALGQPIVVETDQQKLDAEISARLQRLAERRMQSRVAPATQAATEEAAQETAEAVAQEQKHIPMNEDGTVNEAAFWMQDPEGYVQWNDEQNKDGGQDSLRQIAIAKQEFIALLADVATGQNTSNPTMRKAAEKEVAIIQDKIAQLEAMEQRYAETLVENVKQTAATPTATMNEEQLEQMDAQYQGILSMTRVPSERVRVMQEYLNKLAEGSVPVVLLTKQNYEEKMKADGLHNAIIRRVKAQVDAGRSVAGFMANGKVYLMDEGLNSIDAARITYIHERQHTFNRANNDMLTEVANLLESKEKAIEILKTYVGERGIDAYESLTIEGLADEIVAYSMEIAYTTEEFSVDLQSRGIPSEVISIITEIDNEQRKDQSLSQARRRRGVHPYAAVSGAGSLQEDGRNIGQVSGGILESEAARPSGVSGRGTQTGEGAEPGAEVISEDEEEAEQPTAEEVLAEDGFEIDEQNEDVRFSVRYLPTPDQREGIIDSIVAVTGRTRDEAERWLDSELSLASIVLTDQEYLDYAPDAKYKAIKDNSDYPQGTVDFNNICRKRKDFTRMYTRLQRSYPNRIFTAEDLADIRTIMSEDGLTVACGLCYVEDRRQKLGEVANAFIEDLQDGFRNYAKKNATKKANAAQFAVLVSGDTYVPSIYDLITLEGSDKLYEEHRGIWEAFGAYNRARGQQTQNTFQGYAEYKREILTWSDAKVKKVNSLGGLRIFSYSDFEAHHLLDIIQIIIDCAARGVMIQGYTKVPEFARVVEKTGIKLNRSLIPLGDTGIVDGKLAYDPVEGIDINDPNFLESNDNVGNILIGINDEQIRMAMADPFIHYIIPYHARQAGNIRAKLNVGAWTNYIDTQNERKMSDGKRVEKNINIYTDVLDESITNDREFVEKYLEVCREKGYIPKFDQFLDKDAEGNYVYTPGYYKFLVDFKLFDEQGNILPQKPVIAEFDDAFNAQVLNDYAREERETTGAAMNSTYDKIVETLDLGEPTEGEDVRFKIGEGSVDILEEAKNAAVNDVMFRFIGEQAAIRLDNAVNATMFMDNLQTAREMESELNPDWSAKEDEDALKIKAATGWERGADGKWRHEMPDFEIKAKPGRKKTFKLQDLITDSSLFIEYPQLKDVKVRYKRMASGLMGEVVTENGQTYINMNDIQYQALNPRYVEAIEAFSEKYPEIAEKICKGGGRGVTSEEKKIFIEEVGDVLIMQGPYLDAIGGRETLAHEIQHLIQEYEGFAEGGNSQMVDTRDPLIAKENEALKKLIDAEINAANSMVPELNDLVDQLRKLRAQSTVNVSLQNEFDQKRKEFLMHKANVTFFRNQRAKLRRIGDEGYKRLAGEVEARNVEKRINLSDAERRALLYTDTQDVDTKDQIFLRNNLMVDFTEDMLSFRISPRTDEQREKLFEDAKAKYGTTKNFNAAGYMLPDGSLLDFSEANDGGDPNSRSLDHRDIEGIIMDNGVEYDSRWMYIADFMNEGAIRLLPESAGINMIQAPTEEQRKKIFDFIYKYNGEVILEINDERLNSVVYMEYDRRTSPSRIFRDIDGYFNEGIVPQQDVRFRVSNQKQAIFVSNAAKAVEGIKQEKATPEQWLKMIEKAGGLKAGEDKWMGLSDWLNASDKKTLTKGEVLEFINEHKIIIEEQHYADSQWRESERVLNQKYPGWEEAFSFDMDEYSGRAEAFIEDNQKAMELYNANHKTQVSLDEWDEFSEKDENRVEKFGVKLANIRYGKSTKVREIHGERARHTTNGLANLHEIALTVPNIEPWEGEDTLHFGDAGDGRAVAWIRFGETYGSYTGAEVNRYLREKYGAIDYEQGNFSEEDWDKLMQARKQGKKVLVIDEIQSNRHQEGRKRGYKDIRDIRAIKQRKAEIEVEIEALAKAVLEGDRKAKRQQDALFREHRELSIQHVRGEIPDAPFEKNWAELAMKRMLRYAAENGYDVVAWTKGDQQAYRYNLSRDVKRISASKQSKDGERIVNIYYRDEYDDYKNLVVDKEGKVIRGDYKGSALADVVGKEMALQIMNAEAATEFKGEGLKIGGEGMRGFYDKMLPAFMNKYGKKWGVRVEDIELPNLEEAGQTMHSIPVTEEMKASVMEGQVMFRTTEITPEVRAEMDVIAATAIVNGNYMKAPNGADTNLTPEQWAMVRTKNFKAWFGDWENDPENASKVVDENGEPKVVYHGTPNMFWEFRFNHIDPSNELGGGYYFGTKELAEIYTRPNDDNRHLVDGMIDKFFDEHPDKSAGNIEDFNEAEEWAEQEAFKNARLMPVFLNIRKPFVAKEQDDFFNEFAGYFDTVGQGLWYKGYDGVIDESFYARHGNDFDRPLPKGTVQYFVVNPSKIKSATDNVGTFREEEMWQDDDIRFRIGKARKEQMRKGLKTKLTVLSEQEVEKTIDEIEKLGETHKKGGDSKVEKVAFHWVLKGSVILPEDNYKIDEAIKVAERAKVNPMDYDSPMDLITAFKEFESKVPAIDPDTVKEFSNKTELPSGIVVYNVQDDAAGQAAVRKIIDTHWGEDANPWCLAARFGDDLQAAFYYWKQYSKYPKRIAFRNGKLLAFFASQSSKVWWDRKDTPSSGIPYSVKSKDRDFVVTTSFEYDEEIGEVREKETVKRNEKKGVVIQYQGKKLVAANVDSQDLVLEYTNFGDKTRTLVSEGKQYVQIRYKEDFELSSVSIVGKNPARYSFINGKLAMIEDRPEGSKRVIIRGEFRSELSLGNGWRLEFDENGELRYAIKGDYRAEFENGEPAYIDVRNMPYAKRIDGQWRDSAFPQYMANPLLNSFISGLHNFLDNHSTKRDDYPQFDMLSNYPSELVEAIKEAEGNLNETVGETVVDTLGLLNSSEIDENEVSFRVVTDPAKIEELENGPKIKVYRAMQLIDGKLYPPMSAKVDGQLRQPIELGQWEEAEERPDLADDKGYFKLDKGNKKSLKARYNPYFHASYTPLNDQFSEAQDRPNLVIVEVEIPASELTSGYKADKAKDSVGEKEWKAGVIQGKLSGTRKVILSRWDKPVRIVPDSEVADVIVKMFEGKNIVMPSNVVTPSLRAELEKRGVPFVETDNKGKPQRKEDVFAKEFFQLIDDMFSGKKNLAEKYQMKYFDLAETPDFYKSIGIIGDKFTVKYGTISAHFGKDEDHRMTEEAWKELPSALANPIFITQYGNKSNKFRIYTSIKLGDRFVIAGVDVIRSNQGKNKPMIEINSIRTVFAAKRIGDEEKLICYNAEITPEQEALLNGRNFRQYPTIQELSDSKDSDNIDTSNESDENPSFRVTGTPTDEVVASGLDLSPAQTADLAGNIFAALPESARAEVTASLNGDILGLQDAIMQIPARLAMKENWDETDKELASVVREKVQDIVDSKGATSRPLTTKEALWMLHNTGDSYDLISAATDAIVARNLGFDPESIRRRKDVDDYIRFRAGSQGAIDAATDMYNYETSLWTERLKESWLDMNQSVVALQNAMSQASGMPIEPWENVVYALNRLSSKSYADKQKYLRDYLTPLWDAVIRIIKHTDFKIEDVERYMMLKHALERNEIFAKRDAKEFYRNMYDEVAKKMKSQSHAERVVALSEAKKALADIDAQIATASGSELRRLMDQRVNAQYKVDVADLVLRGDETRNEADLQAYYSAIEAGADPKYLEFREKDYSGLTAMYTTYANVRRSNYKSEEAYQKAVLANQQPIYDNVADMESAARMEVDNFENHMAPEAVTNLWDKVNAATKEVLRHQYESGMIAFEQYEAVRDMFEHYVPLRGFADNTAEDMYSYYMNNSSNGFSMPIIGAKGRKTRAESPLGWIGTMAESAIQADNKNEAKMCLYYAVLRRPGQNLLSITDTWFEYSHTENGKKVYKPAYPPQTDRVLNADELRQHMEDWEKDMKSKQAQGKAFKGTQSVNLRGSVIFQDDKQEKEHIIRVKVAGKDYSILINGNPRAAQAINGLLNPDANVGPIKEWMGWARRGLSSLLTSFSPLFWVANYQRDLLSSTMRTSEAYGWYDAMKYLANRRKAWRVASYIYKYQNGTLGDTYYEKLYKEFAENGGITGYTALTTNKEYEKLLAEYAKEVRNHSVIKWAKGVFDKFMSFGEAIEQVSRFAAFITARESGKAIEEAVNAAKEVSVNFNRKGSTKPISREELDKLRTKKGEKLNGMQKIAAIVLSAMPSWLKELYFFFNASVQAISSSLKLAAKSPGKAAGWAGAYFGMSIAMAWINYLLGDDDDEYLDLPDYLRHSTVLIKVGDEYYIKWSIPQEMRPFYAWADMIVSKAMGKMPHKSLGKEMALAAAQWLPVNPFESEDPLLSLVPDVASPIVEAVANKTSFGGKIYDDMAFKSEGTVQDIPAYRKATDKTGKVYVELSEILNAISGGDEVQKGWANINPAAIEHLVEGYGGGIYDFAKMMVTFPGLVIDAATGEKEMEIKNIPFVNKVVMSVDETNMYSHTNDAFYHYKGIAESAKRIEKEYAESDDPSRAEAYREEEDWRIYLLYKQYEEDFKDVKERLDNAVDETETDLLKQEQNVLREMFLNDIAKGELPEVTFEIREDIKRIEKDVKKIMKPADDANKERLEKKRAGDVDGMVRAIERRDSLKDTPEYQRAEEISKEVKAIKKKLQELGTVERRSQRDSVIGELQRDYERLKERMSDEISQLP